MHEQSKQRPSPKAARLLGVVRALSPLVLLASLAILQLDCSFQSPSAPTWDADLSVPLIAKTFTMSKFVEDEDHLFVGQDSLVHFEFEQNLDRYYVGDKLKIDGFDQAFNFQLGVFRINEPPPENVGIVLGDIFPPANQLGGLRVPVPAFQFAPDPVPLDPFQEFDYVVLERADVSIRLDNNLPIPLGPSLLLEIRDGVMDTVIATVSHNQIVQPGDFFVENLQLGHTRLPNTLSVRVEGGSPGSSTPVPIDPQASFRITTQIHTLEVSEASAQIPPQHLEGTELVALSDSVVVTEAKIKSGLIHVTLQGAFPLDGLLTFSFPDFVNASGQPLGGQLRLSRNAVNEFDVDVSNYRFVPEPAPLGQQKVRFHWLFDSDDSGTQRVLVKSTDQIQAQVNVSPIIFSEIAGTVYDQTIDIDQQTFQLDIPSGLDSVILASGRLELTINNAINFPVRTDIMIEGQDDAGVRTEVEVREVIQAASSPGVPTPTTIVFDTNNQQVAAFINSLPTLVRVFGRVVVGDEQWQGRITANDFVDGKVRFTAPLALSLPAQTVEEVLDEVQIDQDVRKQVKKRVGAGQLVAQVGNHLPVGARVEIFFGAVDSLVFQQPEIVLGPVEIGPGQVDEATGRVAEETVQEARIEVTKDQIERLFTAPLYAGLRVAMPGTNGKVVRVAPTDYVRVKAFAKVQLQVDFNK